MSAYQNACLAIDASFDINGIDAAYHVVWPGPGAPCRVIPDRADVLMELGEARASQPKSSFAVRHKEVRPVKGSFLLIRDVLFRINEVPAIDDMRMVYRLSCVRA